MSIKSVWNCLFTQEELDVISKYPERDRRHPLKRIIIPGGEWGGQDGQVAANTERALKLVKEHNLQWIMSIKKRLKDISDYSNSSGALSELRAYGYLLESGIEVIPVARKKNEGTPEFKCKYGGHEFIVEVHAKQMERDETINLQKFHEMRFEGGAASYKGDGCSTFWKS